MRFIKNKLFITVIISLITTAVIAQPGPNRRIMIENNTDITFKSIGCLGSSNTVAPNRTSIYDKASRNHCTFWLENHMSVEIAAQSNLRRNMEVCGSSTPRTYSPQYYSDKISVTATECLTPALGNRSTVTIKVTKR